MGNIYAASRASLDEGTPFQQHSSGA